MWALVGRETGCDSQCDSLLHSNRDFPQIIRFLFSTETAPDFQSDDTGTSSLTSEFYFWRLDGFNARSTCAQNTLMSLVSNSVSLFCKTCVPFPFICELCACICVYVCVFMYVFVCMFLRMYVWMCFQFVCVCLCMSLFLRDAEYTFNKGLFCSMLWTFFF